MDLLKLKENIISNVNELFTIHFDIVEKHTKEKQKLNNAMNNLNEIITRYSEEVKQKDKMLSVKDSTIHDYENTIAELKQERKDEEDATNRASMIRTLHKNISDKDKYIKELEDKLEKVSMNNKPNKVIKEIIKDKETDSKDESMDEIVNNVLDKQEETEEEVKDDEQVKEEELKEEVKEEEEKKAVKKKVKKVPKNEVKEQQEETNNVENGEGEGEGEGEEDSGEEEQEDEHIAFKYNGKDYCIKNIEKPKEYYMLTETFEIGEKVGTFKFTKYKKKESVQMEDLSDGIKYIFERDDKYVIGKKVAYFDKDGNKKKIK